MEYIDKMNVYYSAQVWFLLLCVLTITVYSYLFVSACMFLVL